MKIAALIVSAVAGVAVYGWLTHWNAYTNLSLTLGAIGLAVVWRVAVSRGS